MEDLLGGGGTQSLAWVRPAAILGFHYEAEEANWPPGLVEVLRQTRLFGPTKVPLRRPPWRFYVRYRCSDTCTHVHDQSIVDWEVLRLSFRTPTDPDKVIQRLEWMRTERDLSLFVGNALAHPRAFMVVGLFYPPKAKRLPRQRTLF